MKKNRLNSNVLVIGGPGTGKTQHYIKPNLLRMNSSFVIMDNYGELFSSVGKALESRGYKIKILNYNDPEHSEKYNPLHHIRNEADVDKLVNCFLQNTESKSAVKGDVFFEEAERSLLSACVFWALTHNDGIRSLLHIQDMLECTDGNDLDNVFVLCGADSLALKNYTDFIKRTERTNMGKTITRSLLERMSPLAQIPKTEVTSADTLDFRKIGEEKTALFIVFPKAPAVCSFMAPLLYTQIIRESYIKEHDPSSSEYLADKSCHIHLMMDEFANMGVIPGLTLLLPIMRRYNMSASLVIQSISQLKEAYPSGWKMLLRDCDTILFLGASDRETIDFITERAGTYTMTYGMGEGKCLILEKGHIPHVAEIQTD